MKVKLLVMLKIVVSGLSIWYVTRQIDAQNIKDVITGTEVKFVLLALLVFWFAQFVSSLRCAYIVGELGNKLPFIESARAHFIGLWFNQVLPTGLGGDVFKVAILKAFCGLGVALRAAILDRFSGLFILMLATAILLPLYWSVIPSEQTILKYALSALSVSFILVTIVFAYASTRIRSRFSSTALVSKLFFLGSDIWLFRKGHAFWRQMWTSTVVHFNGIAAYSLLGAALGLEVNILVFVLLVPLVFLVALLPISLAGWGIREAGAVWLFGLVGMSKENALVLSVAYGLMLIVAGVPGLVWFLRGKRVYFNQENLGK